jgi:hypothetical protein
VKNNKFLSTYFLVLGVGVIGLGYLCYSGYSSYSEAKDKYDSARSSVESLEQKPLFPNDSNVARLKTAVDAYSQDLNKLQSKLATYQTELETSTDAGEFKTRWGKAVEEVKALCDASNVAKPNELDLGFGAYSSDAPPREAVQDLNFELQGIKSLTDTIIRSHATALGGVVRSKLPSEMSKAPEPAANAKTSKPSAKKAATVGPELAEDQVLRRYPFAIRFTGSPRTVEEVLNEIANTQAGTQLFAVRYVRIENEKKVAASKGSSLSSSSRHDDDEKKKTDGVIILGAEQVTAELHLDLIRIHETAKAPEATKPAPKAAQ